VFPLILQAHEFLIVIFHIIITPFLVPLNERESRGGQTNRCLTAVQLTVNSNCCQTAVQIAVIGVASPAGVESRFGTQFCTRTVYQKTPPQKLQLCRYAIPLNSSPCNSNPTMVITYILPHTSSHVPTYLQHVTGVKAAKHVHVVAPTAGLNLSLGDVPAPKIHQHYQCDEVFNVLQQVHICFAKVKLQDSI
jgi:hypothetical protein